MRLRKLLIGAGILAASVTASAQEVLVQETAVVAETATEVFNPHWSLSLQGGAAYTLGENKFDKLISPAVQLQAGYRFSPLFGIRFGALGWQGKGSWVAPRTDYKWKFVQPNIDAVLSLTNLFCEYNPNRVIDAYAFLGFGATIGFDNGAKDLNLPFLKLWDGTQFFPAGRGGLGIDFNLNKTVALNIEGNAFCTNDKFNSKKGSAADWQFNVLVGVKINFGRTRTIAPVVAEVVEEPVAVVEPEPAPAPKPAPAPAPEPKKIEPLREDIFFTINSTRIHSAEQIKIDALVSYMKANPESKVVVTGYADKDTGTAAYNMNISKRRAEKVVNALIAAGIAPERISTEYKGSSEQPFAENKLNRVAICIAGEK